MNNNILNKINKCLKLSRSSNTNEAAAALRQAQKLMQKYGLTNEDLALSDVHESSVSTGTKNMPARWLSDLANLVRAAFGVDYLLVENSNTNDFIFIGFGAAAEVAGYTFTVLRRKLVADRKAYYKKCRGKRINRIHRADIFAISWVQSVKQKVHSFAQPINREVVDKYLERNHGDVSTYETKHININNRHTSAIVAGICAAEDVLLHHGVNGEATKQVVYA